MNNKLATPLLVFLTSLSIAGYATTWQCPDVTAVVVNGAWTVPAGWTVMIKNGKPVMPRLNLVRMYLTEREVYCMYLTPAGRSSDELTIIRQGISGATLLGKNWRSMSLPQQPCRAPYCLRPQSGRYQCDGPTPKQCQWTES